MDNRFGPRTEEEKLAISIGTKKAMQRLEVIEKISVDKNSQWRGDEVGYDAKHQWIKNHKPKPNICEICKKNKPYDLANISQKYKRDIDDFEWLCRSCHMKKDGRLSNLWVGPNNCGKL